MLIECTFLYDTKEETHPNINFIVSHFGVRYTPKEIKAFFIKTSLDNVFHLVHDFEELRHLDIVIRRYNNI